MASQIAEPLHPDLAEKLKQVRAKRGFNANDWIEKKSQMFNDYMQKCGLKACLVNVSGGIDSSVTLALLKHAQKMANSPIQRVVGKLSNYDRIYSFPSGFDCI